MSLTGDISMEWPKKPTSWIRERVAYISVPFTWNLPLLKAELQQGSLFYDRAVVGGPGIYLMPHYLDDVENVTVEQSYTHGIMQRVNPQATKTSVGCIRKCKFCAVPKIEGRLKEHNRRLNDASTNNKTVSG